MSSKRYEERRTALNQGAELLKGSRFDVQQNALCQKKRRVR